MSASVSGEQIKRARQTKGISASEFARRAGVTPTCVWNWERGATNPRPNAVVAICKALDIEESALIAGAPMSVPPRVDQRPSLDDVLENAASQIATSLGLARERVRLRFEVSQT